MVCKRRCKQRIRQQILSKTREASRDIFKYAYSEQPYGCGNCLKTFQSKGQIVSHYNRCCQQKKKPCPNAWSSSPWPDGETLAKENGIQDIVYCLLAKAVDNKFQPCKKLVRDRLHQFLLVRQLDNSSQSLHDGISGNRTKLTECQQAEDLNAQTYLEESAHDSTKTYANVVGNSDAAENIRKHEMDVENSKCLKPRKKSQNVEHSMVEHLDGKAFSEIAEVLVNFEKSNNDCCCLDTNTVDHQFQPCKKVVRDHLYQFLMARHLGDNIQNVMMEKNSSILDKENCNAEDLMVQDTRTHFLNGRVTDDLNKVKKSGGKLCRRKLRNKTQSSEALVVEHLDDENFRDMIAEDLSKSIHGVTSCTGVDTVGNYCRPCKKHVRDQLHQLLMSRKLGSSFQYMQDILADTASLQLENCNQERECWKVEDLSSQTCTETEAADPTIGSSCSEKLQNRTENLERLYNLNMSQENHFYKTVDNCKKSVGDECFSQPNKGAQEVKCLPNLEFSSNDYEIDKENFSEKCFQDSERTVGEFCSVKLEKRSPSMECLPMKDISRETDIKEEEEEEIDATQANEENLFCHFLENLVCKTENMVEHFDTVTLEGMVTDNLHFFDQSAGNFCCVKAETVDDQFRPCKKPVRDQLYQFLMARRFCDQLQHVQAESADQTENSSQEMKLFQTEDSNCKTSERRSLAESNSCATDFNTFFSLHVKKEVEELTGSQFKYANYENCKTEAKVTKDHEKSERDDIAMDFTLQGNWSREIRCLNAADLDTETDAKEMIAKVLVTTDERSDNFCSSVTEKLDDQTGPCTLAVRDQLHRLLMSRFAKKTKRQFKLENCGYIQENWSPTVLI